MFDATFPTRAVAAIQPTDRLHLGNYFGALQQTLSFQDIVPRNNFCFVADYHAQTSKKNSWEDLGRLTRSLAMDFLALGLRPEQTFLYRQSDVPEVMEVLWLLSLVTNSATLQGGHKMKEAVPTAAIYLYPLLMSADILALRATHVPIGDDQKQHHDRARDIAARFNKKVHRQLLPVPIGVCNKSSRVPGTDALDPKYQATDQRPKMSKSLENFIPVFCSDEETAEYVNSIVTRPVKWGEPTDPEDDTIYSLYCLMATQAECDELANKMRAGRIGYDEAKRNLTRQINDYFGVARDVKQKLETRPDDVEDILREGAMFVRREVLATLDEIRYLSGLRRYRRWPTVSSS
ncbi:tryptophan--tRNA ligase [Paraburkholderia elongata]|uniref:tryptophan--tRNA ligase n=1 Tax=Paraburkholderia elongata TaxID=2675747 RepID=A0A972NXG5_9BURK|nr:tryptophan--tRNA ligase [Paraburkholderia elongata]NPT61653.1 tryptophan--tRNA ligase [Paraburkholderia elongata]